jgi:hypothetical protein
LIGLLPLGFGILYALRPSEQRLDLMRLVSLAAIFAAILGTTLGFVNVLRYAADRDAGFDRAALIGMAQSLVPLFFDFGCLMLAWLCVAFSLGRRP